MPLGSEHVLIFMYNLSFQKIHYSIVWPIIYYNK